MNCDNTFGLMTEMRGAGAVERVRRNGRKNGHGRREHMPPIRLSRAAGRSVLATLSVCGRQRGARFKILSGNEAMTSGFTMEPACAGNARQGLERNGV